jgi:hypothetical protein
MDEAPLEAGMAEAGPEGEFGDTGGEAQQQPEGGVEPEPPRSYVEVDDPDNRYVRVRVDGEDQEVPYSEALKGYSREADYTRKAQALAQQRQEAEFGIRLQQALQANPEMTLQILAQQYGWQPPGQQAPTPPAEEDSFLDPLERQLAEERQARLSLEQRIAQREADQELERAIGGLRNQYNLNDEDVRTVVQTAYQMNLGVEALPLIYKTMAFDRISARVQAARTQQERERAETARRTTAKTQANQVVGSGTGAGNGLTNQVDAGGRMTLREAIEAAFDQAENG